MLECNQFIEIDAPHLCVLEGESDELNNDGIYGKALAEFLQDRLCELGYSDPSIVCEDWGWYLSVVRDSFRLGICIYGTPRHDHRSAVAIYNKIGGRPDDLVSEPAGVPLELCLQIGTIPGKYWNWRTFRRVDRSGLVHNLFQDILTIFRNDSSIVAVQCCNEFPLYN